MAESLDDGEFWLPPQFLTDDMFMDKGGDKNKKDAFNLETEVNKTLFPLEFPCGLGSGFGLPFSALGSPVESVVGSAEAESDEEDFLAALTRQMAQSTLDGGYTKTEHAFDSDKTKGFLSGSPQSTLYPVGSECGCRGSPNEESKTMSQPGTWDLLYAAAGEVARMRVKKESYGFDNSRAFMGPPRKPSPITIPVKEQPNIYDAGFYSRNRQQLLSHHKLQAAQFQYLKQQQMMRQQQGSVWGGPQTNGAMPYQVAAQNRVRTSCGARPLGLSQSAWPPLQQAVQQQPPQQPNGSGMRAVFLGAPGAKRESTGTGVFLPRRVNTPAEPRKKPAACSTVLLPAKVVQALNLNFDDMGTPCQPRSGSYGPESDVPMRFRHGNSVAYQKRNLRPQQGMNHEVRLPPEWTY